MKVERITLEELKARMDSGQAIQILDVRNRIDYMRSGKAIPGSIRVPANKVVERLGELNPEIETVAYCT